MVNNLWSRNVNSWSQMVWLMVCQLMIIFSEFSVSIIVVISIYWFSYSYQGLSLWPYWTVDERFAFLLPNAYKGAFGISSYEQLTSLKVCGGLNSGSFDPNAIISTSIHPSMDSVQSTKECKLSNEILRDEILYTHSRLGS